MVTFNFISQYLMKKYNKKVSKMFCWFPKILPDSPKSNLSQTKPCWNYQCPSFKWRKSIRLSFLFPLKAFPCEVLLCLFLKQEYHLLTGCRSSFMCFPLTLLPRKDKMLTQQFCWWVHKTFQDKALPHDVIKWAIFHWFWASRSIAEHNRPSQVLA